MILPVYKANVWFVREIKKSHCVLSLNQCVFFQVPPRNLLITITVPTTLTAVGDAVVIKEDAAVAGDHAVVVVVGAIMSSGIVLMTIGTAPGVGKNPSFNITSREHSVRPGDPTTREEVTTTRTTITEAATTITLATTRKIGKCRRISIRTGVDREEAEVAPDGTKITTRLKLFLCIGTF